MNEIFQAYKKNLNVSDKAEERYLHCLSCTLFDSLNGRCDNNKQAINIKTKESTSGCGCSMQTKVKLEGAKCPLSKW